jgi:flagellar capping protein FliD
MAGANDTVDA